jgi:division protein CdvB (Snf7/Vps24/ESCRT-III family)
MRLAFWRRRKAERREVNPNEILDSVSIIRARLSRRVRDIEVRERELFEQVVRAHMERDQERAAMYAEELAELRKALRRLVHANLLLEGVLYRIEAVKDMQDAGRVVLPLKDVLAAASQEIRGIAPTASDELDKLVSIMEDLSVEVGTFHEPTIAEMRLSDEARKILEEAGAIAAQRRGEQTRIMEAGS